MEIEGRSVAILGGSGLVGRVIARRLLSFHPARIVIGALREGEARGAVGELEGEATGRGVELVPEWGDVFLRESHKLRSRAELLADAARRSELLDDLFEPLDEEVIGRSGLVNLLVRHRPEVVVDCINSSTAIAYQDVFDSARRMRERVASHGSLEPAEVEAHLSTLYLPQLIRHVQLLLEGLRRAGAKAYVKVGTTGTGGMGLNVPFTHSEERPSRPLLAKASLAGAQSLLLFLMGRTPDTPAIAEVKPAAAISWKRIGFGPIERGGKPIARYDAARAVPLTEAFGPEAEGRGAWRKVEETIESVYLDAGENGMFSTSEFETISSLGLMEIVTPEEIAAAVIDEIRGRPTGHDVVSALDAVVMGPSYRGGMLREAALQYMERLEREHGVRSVAFEMLGPPRLSKLLYEAAILEQLFSDVEAAAGLDPEETSSRAVELIESDDRLRTEMLSVGIPILLPQGDALLRGPAVQIEPPSGDAVDVDAWTSKGWVDLRPDSWVQWRERCRAFREAQESGPGPESGSVADLDLRAASGSIRAGTLAAFVVRVEDGGERTKR